MHEATNPDVAGLIPCSFGHSDETLNLGSVFG